MKRLRDEVLLIGDVTLTTTNKVDSKAIRKITKSAISHVLAGPDGATGAQADAVPYDMEMLATVFDVLDDDALVVARFVTEPLLETFANPSDLIVREALVLVRIDADVM